LLLSRLSEKSNACPGGSGQLASGCAFMCRKGANRSVAAAVTALLMGNREVKMAGFELREAR